jgi:hypothetical protein
MKEQSPFRKNFLWGLMAFLAIGIAFSATAPYMTFNSADFNGATARYAGESSLRVIGLYVHMFGGGIALLIGPFQFLGRIRDRRRTSRPEISNKHVTVNA